MCGAEHVEIVDWSGLPESVGAVVCGSHVKHDGSALELSVETAHQCFELHSN